MRVLFTCIPSDGHYQALVPLARAAAGAGHTAAFACAASLRPTFAALGLESLPAGLGRDGGGDPEFDALKRKAQRTAPGADTDRLAIVDVVYGVRARRMLPDLVDVCERWRPDLIVHEAYEAAGAAVADDRRIPHANVEVMPLYDERPFAGAIQQKLDDVRAELGLAPQPHMLRRHMNVCFAPPSLLDREVSGPHPPRAFRPDDPAPAEGERLPPQVEQLAPDRTAYVSFGTVATRFRPDAIDLLHEIVAGLHLASMDVVVTVGRDVDPAALGPQPPNVHVARYIPQSLLLPRVRFTVSHAGFNTVLAAIGAGLPQVLVPLLADNVFNARRCGAIGAAEVLPPDRVTKEAVARAARAVSDDSRYPTKARELKDEMARLPGPEAAIALFEQLAHGAQGVA